jgi:hypothetical protein
MQRVGGIGSVISSLLTPLRANCSWGAPRGTVPLRIHLKQSSCQRDFAPQSKKPYKYNYLEGTLAKAARAGARRSNFWKIGSARTENFFHIAIQGGNSA